MGVKNVKKLKSAQKPSQKKSKYPPNSILVEWKNNEIYIINSDEVGKVTSNKMDREDVLKIVANFIEKSIELVCAEATEGKQLYPHRDYIINCDVLCLYLWNGDTETL